MIDQALFEYAWKYRASNGLQQNQHVLAYMVEQLHILTAYWSSL